MFGKKSSMTLVLCQPRSETLPAGEDSGRKGSQDVYQRLDDCIPFCREKITYDTNDVIHKWYIEEKQHSSGH